MTPTRNYHRGQHRSRGEIAPCCLERLDENTRTRTHERALELHTFSRRFGVLQGFLPCGGHVCADSAEFQVNGIPLCRDHATKRVARRMRGLHFAVFIEFAREHDFHPLQDEVA